MNRVIELFYEITAIPRCSTTHTPFIEYMKEFAARTGYECHVDKVNNILCKKTNSKANLCLQGHYDIVCLVDNLIPKIIEEDGFLKANNSTLGADNGIACAYMLKHMENGDDLEYLFTSDEEIGLIGANEIEFELQSSFMLNIDSEDEGDICIGCAGGVDIRAKSSNKKIIKNVDNLDLYEIKIGKLAGGHSGVDIHNEVPNGIKLIAKTIKECDGLILDINGGERINSIPVNVKAIIASKVTPSISHENMTVEKIDSKSDHLNVYSDELVNFLYSFANGVRGYNTKLGVVLTSINLALVHTSIDDIQVELSARSMDNGELKRVVEETTVALQSFGFNVKTSGKYPAWKPEHNQFAQDLLDIYKLHIPTSSLEAIHAGLECAIFKDKFPDLQIASIGPNIFNPHSNSERVEISSVLKVEKVVEEIIEKYNK